MSFIINDDGTFAVGEPGDDPTRQAHAKLIAMLAWELEMGLQSHECHDAAGARQQAQITELAKRVSMLEALLAGNGRRMIGHLFEAPGNPFADQDACAGCGAPRSAHASPELRARITAASAAVAGFIREEDAWLNDESGSSWRLMPDWQSQALRMRAELVSLLSVLGGDRE